MDTESEAQHSLELHPRPPEHLNAVSAGCWFASALLMTARERQYSPDETVMSLLTFLAMSLSRIDANDERLVAEFERALRRARGGREA